jgi:hypothetical protein
MVLAAVCFFAFIRIGRHEPGNRFRTYFRYYFLALALGALFGGLLGHAFLYRVAEPWKLVSWILTLVSVGILAHALVELARPLVRTSLCRILIGINLLVLLIALVFTVGSLSFVAVQYYIAFGMVAVVGSLSFILYLRTGDKGPATFLIAVGIGLVSAVIFRYEWGLGPWFNHKDISHLVLTLSALVIYRGALIVLASRADPDRI